MRGKELFFKSFSMLDRAGLHVMPKHYYTPVPDCAWLENNRPLWIGRSSLTGIAWNLPDQLAWLQDACAPYYHEVAGLNFYRSLTRKTGPGFGEIEAQVLHCFMRRYAPPRVIEIGSGVSTMCMLEADRLNQQEGRYSHITCVEPYPSESLRSRKEVELVEQVCQEVPQATFNQLSEGDLLFIDSSHAVKVGSDVLRIYLEIIPNLPPGIFLHIHDIYLPYAYPRTVFTKPFWWQETAMLMALLINNPRVKVLNCLSALHYDYPEQMQQVLTDYRPEPSEEGLVLVPVSGTHFPASIWLQTV